LEICFIEKSDRSKKKMTASFYFSLELHIIDKLNEKMGRQMTRKEIGIVAKNYLIAIAEGKDFKNVKEVMDDLKQQKLRAEILKLNIDNKLKLLRELKLTPDEIVQIMKGETDFSITEELQVKKDKLSSNQWDYVYGCCLQGYKKNLGNLTIECLVCRDKFSKDETAVSHIVANHPETVKNAIKEMGYNIE